MKQYSNYCIYPFFILKTNDRNFPPKNYRRVYLTFIFRNTICSHLIYNKFKLKEKVDILSFGLLLINNAIVFMKNPYWNIKVEADN